MLQDVFQNFSGISTGPFTSNQTVDTKLSNLPKPLQVLQQYKAWHSLQALQEHHRDHRRFSLAHYSCPMQAGNRLLHFTNSAFFNRVP